MLNIYFTKFDIYMHSVKAEVKFGVL